MQLFAQPVHGIDWLWDFIAAHRPVQVSGISLRPAAGADYFGIRWPLSDTKIGCNFCTMLSIGQDWHKSLNV